MHPYDPPTQLPNVDSSPQQPSRLETSSHDFLFACLLMLVVFVAMLMLPFVMAIVFAVVNRFV